MNQNLTTVLKDLPLEASPFISVKKGREAIVEALVLPGKFKDLHIAIQNLRPQVEGVKSVVYEDTEYKQDWTKFSVDKVIKVRLEYKHAIGFQHLINVDEKQLIDEVNHLFSSRHSLNSMMIQKGPRFMYFENYAQQLRGDVKIKDTQGTVTNENVDSFLTFQGFKYRKKEITSGILYPFDFGEEIFIYRRRLKQVSAKETNPKNLDNTDLKPEKSANLNHENKDKDFHIMDESIDEDYVDNTSDEEDMEEENETYEKRKYYYCIIFKKRIASDEQDERAIEHVINFSKWFEDYLITYNKGENI